MKITSLDKISCCIIETDEDEHFTYLRLGVDNWFVRMGESFEPVYHDCTKLETLFQNMNKLCDCTDPANAIKLYIEQ